MQVYVGPGYLFSRVTSGGLKNFWHMVFTTLSAIFCCERVCLPGRKSIPDSAVLRSTIPWSPVPTPIAPSFEDPFRTPAAEGVELVKANVENLPFVITSRTFSVAIAEGGNV